MAGALGTCSVVFWPRAWHGTKDRTPVPLSRSGFADVGMSSLTVTSILTVCYITFQGLIVSPFPNLPPPLYKSKSRSRRSRRSGRFPADRLNFKCVRGLLESGMTKCSGHAGLSNSFEKLTSRAGRPRTRRFMSSYPSRKRGSGHAGCCRPRRTRSNRLPVPNHGHPTRRLRCRSCRSCSCPLQFLRFDSWLSPE